MKQTISLREDVSLQSRGELSVDREHSVVRNVKLSGLESKNGRTYLPEAYRAALPLYEGARCNIDHPHEDQRDTPFIARFGKFHNARLTNDVPRADLTYNPAHPYAETFLWWAENCPEAIGLSHNAEGEGSLNDDGKMVVDRISAVHSIDLVADPATNKGLFESTQPMPVPPDANLPPPTDPLAPAPAPAPLEDPNAPDAGGDWKSKVADAMQSLMSDDTKEPSEKWQAMEMLFNAVHGPGASTPPADPDAEASDADTPDTDTDTEDEPADSGDMEEDCDMSDADKAKAADEKKAVESVKKLAAKDPAVKRILESYDALKVEKAVARKTARARAACKTSGLAAVAITDIFVESLVSRKEGDWQKLIEDRRLIAAAPTATRPTSAAAGPVGDSFDQFMEGLRSAA